MAAQLARKTRTFPWECPKCQRREVYPARIAYQFVLNHEGVSHALDFSALDVPQCRNCLELVVTNNVGDQVHSVLRARLGLLQPEEIAAGRCIAGISPVELAQCLGFADDAIERFEDGLQIQTRRQDQQLREFFAGLSTNESKIVPPAANNLIPTGAGQGTTDTGRRA